MDESTLITKYDRMIHDFANKMLCNYESSDVCMDRDDILQVGRMYVLEAIRQYDPNRGAKLTTFVHLKLFTKFANLGRNFKVRNKRGTMNFSHMGKYSILDETDESVLEPSFGGVGGEDSINKYLDLAITIDQELTAFERKIFFSFYINGLSHLEIAEKDKRVRAGRIRETIDQLKELFSEGGFNERRVKGRVGKGWFDSPRFDGATYDNPPISSGDRGYENKRRRKIDKRTTRTCVQVDNKAQDRNKFLQLQLSF